MKFNLNVTAIDFRQYDNALGRFYSPDLLSELAYNQTPYRFGFNNPAFWSDPTGLFEGNPAPGGYYQGIQSDGSELMGEMIIPVSGSNNNYDSFRPSSFGISYFYGFEQGIGGSARGGGGGGSKGLQFTEYIYSVAGAYGAEAFKKGTYTQTNGATGNFQDRPYKQLSRNAKANYDFAKSLKYLKKAGTVATVVSGTIEVSNGVIQDYNNYTATGYTNGQHTVTAAVKVGTVVAVGWAAGAATGALIGSSFPIVGTVIGAAVGGYMGYIASEATGSYMSSIYD